MMPAYLDNWLILMDSTHKAYANIALRITILLQMDGVIH